MDYSLICPVCSTVYYEEMKYCGECGCDLTEMEAVTLTVNPSNREKLVDNLKKRAKIISEKTQKGLSNATDLITDKAFSVGEKASNLMVQERVSEAMGNLVNLMINVSRDVTQSIPAEMVNAIDLEAEVNFVAFTIGVTIDLAELNKGKTIKVEPIEEIIPDSMGTS